MTPFSLTRDINGYNGFGLAFADDKYSATVAQSTDTTLTVPSSFPAGYTRPYANARYLAIFSYEPGAQVWVANNETAAIPAGASFASTTSELNPSARVVAGDDVLHFYTADATGAAVGVIFYALF